MTAVSHPQHRDITLEVNEQIIEVFIIEKPAPRIILVTTLEVRQYELNWWVKHLRSTKHRGLATLAAKQLGNTTWRLNCMLFATDSFDRALRT